MKKTFFAILLLVVAIFSATILNQQNASFEGKIVSVRNNVSDLSLRLKILENKPESKASATFGATILFVPQGGTGASTLSGFLVGNGTAAFTGTTSPYFSSFSFTTATGTSATSSDFFVSGLASTTNLRSNTGIIGNLTSSLSSTGSTTVTNFLSGNATTTRLTATANVYALALTGAAGTPSSICQNTANKEITVNAALTCTVSDEEQKNHIQGLGFSALEMIRQVKPISFYYNADPARLRYGFGAQSLQKVDPRLADAYDKQGIARSIDLAALISLNTKAIQELDEKVKALEKENTELKAKLK